jgi:hypothetical protein
VVLAEEAPDGGDGTEQSVEILEAVLVDGIEDARLGQGIGEGETRAARKSRSITIV